MCNLHRNKKKKKYSSRIFWCFLVLWLEREFSTTIFSSCSCFFSSRRFSSSSSSLFVVCLNRSWSSLMCAWGPHKNPHVDSLGVGIVATHSRCCSLWKLNHQTLSAGLATYIHKKKVAPFSIFNLLRYATDVIIHYRHEFLNQNTILKFASKEKLHRRHQ